ncbi:uncharacterized protein [Hoplias malabaricus]|uniref:uncharacterized protein n=1 Tax=Hoplias malabaricus TaxID=27720 RepID=UPI003462AB19
MYLLVEFTEEGTTSPLPKDWVINDLAWWPPYKDQSTFLRSIKNREIPKPDKGWTQHQVRVLYESDKLDNVTRKWKASCNTSDLNSDEETRKKSRSRKRPCWWSDEDDEDSSITKRPKNKFPQPPQPPNVPTPSIHRVRQQPKEANIRTLPSFQMSSPPIDGEQGDLRTLSSCRYNMSSCHEQTNQCSSFTHKKGVDVHNPSPEDVEYLQRVRFAKEILLQNIGET